MIMIAAGVYSLRQQLTISVCLAGEVPLIDFLIRGQSVALHIFMQYKSPE